MAQVLEKDPATYSKERDGFLRDLQHFHDTRGTPYKKLPTIGGREVDLYLLYTLVTAQGGWLKVNSKNAWPDLLQHFHLPSKCVNGSIALKQVYLRYLDRWEKVHYLGEEGDRGSDDDDEGRHKKCSARALHMVPLTYNYNQHNVNEANREFNHLSANLFKPTDYDRLALSLLSPLPNEQDFAINVCTLLSNDGKHTLKVEKNPRLLDYLLAHAGVFDHESTRKLFIHHYNVIREHPIHNFWDEVLESKEILDLIQSAAVEDKKTDQPPEVPVKAENSDTSTSSNGPVVVAPEPEAPVEVPMDVDADKTEPVITVEESDDNDLFNLDDDDDVDRQRSKRRMRINSSDKNLFCLERTLGTQDYLGQRVLQIATILRNLSFIEDNVPVLAKNRTFVRFILLCSSSKWNYLKNLGLDMLGNIASEFVVKELTQDKLASALLTIVTRALDSQDRLWCLSSLEMLNKLSQNEKNEEVLLRSLETTVYERVCSFLTIHDVMLLIYTLECLYSLSSLGERSCNLIVNNHGVVDTLVSLVTVEGKSYGPKACIGMKLVETVSGVAPVASANPSNTAASASVGQAVNNSTNNTGLTSFTTPAMAKPTNTTSSIPRVLSSPAVAKTVATPTSSKFTPVSTPVRTVQMAPQRLMSVSPSPPMPTAVPVSTPATTTQTTSMHHPMTPQQLIQQQHAHQQAIHENEQFALAWLRATYEPCINSKINSQELYKHYINSCTKIGRRGVISPLHFPRCVRSVFGGTVGPNPTKLNNPKDPQYYDGIKALAHPHLSQALLGNISSNINTSTAASPMKEASQQQTTASQQGSNTSLIKSLLANKVNECMSTVSMRTAECQKVVQVAERQQRLLAQQGQTVVNKTPIKLEPQPNIKVNGARQLFGDEEVGDPSVSSTTPFANTTKGKKEPPQPPPPPLVPLTTTAQLRMVRPVKIDNEDSDSIGNNSLASSTVGVGGVSSTEDGDNSLTSFEGLLNGVPNPDHPLNEDSNSKDSTGEISRNKPLRLADLLEKKVEKTAPIILNGWLCKDRKLTAKGLEMVENHIEKALVRDNKSEPVVKAKDNSEIIHIDVEEELQQHKAMKRPATQDISEVDEKKPCIAEKGVVNGNAPSPCPEVCTKEEEEEEEAAGSATVSTAAAKLFADMAADILEDEDEEQLLQEAQQTPPTIAVDPNMGSSPSVSQLMMDNGTGQMILTTQPRQIIMSQQNATVKQAPVQQQQQTVIVQNSSQQRAPVMLQQTNSGQILLSHQGLQGQVQFVTSNPSGQYVLQTGNAPGAYMVAQPQTAMVHGQPQTVLVAQTPQQHATGAKTIIILQQQPTASNASHHQKVVVTPQGQQVVVTQVPRPVIHSSVSNIQTPTVIKTNPVAPVVPVSTTSTTASPVVHPAVTQIKQEDVKPKIKTKVVKDMMHPFICEWVDCLVATKFKSANEVFLHACEAHCPPNNIEEVVCQWDRCDNLKRKKFSLMTHLHDKHCNTEAMKQSLLKRKTQPAVVKAPEPAPPASTSPHPGYAPDAALHAIKRHALEFVNPKELQDDNEGPVTKSIRLTASLILRNLVIYSGNCRRYLKHYESHLANVALSNVESSRTIAQILYDMNEGSNHR
ncbi:hypothetical protein WA026_009438 [Henosepilachna vigintioctopunctata]|uniref:ARID domain-containing protein n=1 Tax=Henosepilachna vigintioctopunctata TaxID=420089 RepID=A0AAW1U8K1_9CUCU